MVVWERRWGAGGSGRLGGNLCHRFGKNTLLTFGMRRKKPSSRGRIGWPYRIPDAKGGKDTFVRMKKKVSEEEGGGGGKAKKAA